MNFKPGDLVKVIPDIFVETITNKEYKGKTGMLIRMNRLNLKWETLIDGQLRYFYETELAYARGD